MKEGAALDIATRPREPAPAPGRDRPLRILMPSYRSHPFTGGQGVYMRLMTKALAELGHEVTAISGPPYPELDPRVRLIRLPSLDLYARPKTRAGIPAFPWNEVRDRIDLAEYLIHVSGGFGEPYTFGERLAHYMRGRTHQYDIVHDNQTLTYGLLKLEAMGLPVVGMIHHPITMDRRIAIEHAHSLTLKLLIRRWYSFLNMQKRVVRRLDPVIVASECARRDSAREFALAPERLTLVAHGIDTETFHPLPGTARNPMKLIATASADVPLKGLIYLIRALGLLADRHPGIELTVIGSLREGQTSKLIAELGIARRIRWVSGISDAEINRLYAEAAIAVCPSVYEGFGFPAGEAMASGTPVVAAMGGALPEVVGDAGLLVPVKDAGALAAAISRLLDNEELRAELGRKGRERVLGRFQWSRAAREAVAVYERKLSHVDRRTRRAGA